MEKKDPEISEGNDNVALDAKAEQDGKSTSSDTTPETDTHAQEADTGNVDVQDGGIRIANNAIQEHSA